MLGPMTYGAVSARIEAGELTLPQFLETDTGTTQHDFETIGNYSLINCTGEENTSEFLTGSHSLKVTNNAGTSGSVVIQELSTVSAPWNFGGVAPDKFRLYFYAHDISTLYSIVIFLRDIPNGDYFTYTLLNSIHGFRTGWNAIEIAPSFWTVVGGMTWGSDITQLRMQAGTPDTSTQTTVSFDRIDVDPVNRPAVVLSFDDSHESDYTEAFAYMDPLGVRGVTYTIYNVIGGGSRLTSAQLVEMDAAGWDIANHANGDPDTVGTEIAACRDFLNGLGLTGASLHYAYPGGSHGSDHTPPLESAGMLSARTTRGDDAGFEVFAAEAYGNMYHLHGRQVDASASLVDVQGWIDDAISNNEILFLFFHRIVASGATGIDTDRAVFRGIIDYIVGKGDTLPIVTVTDIYESVAGEITVPRVG